MLAITAWKAENTSAAVAADWYLTALLTGIVGVVREKLEAEQRCDSVGLQTASQIRLQEPDR
jgi:hypothetical protein